jgi:hypothetical protein
MSIWEFKVRVFVFFFQFCDIEKFPKKKGEPVKFKLEKKFKNFPPKFVFGHKNL